ncbi:Dabb family protein [Phaeobacter sp.]|uniref:Dabb family protein n=1 Tax=Phaeobacter sp. TaxID=1902409 RepID=UPI0025E74A6A|nr:Dabb family protein [Phaeobacter sp.]
MMIRHIVLVRLRSGVEDHAVDGVVRELAALQSVLPGILSVSGGRSQSPEQIERGYLHGFVIDFDSWAALHRYLEDPRHKEAGQALVALCEGGVEGVLVFDYEVDVAP